MKQPTLRGRIWETAPDASASPPSKWDNSQGPPRKPAAKSLRRTWAGAPLSKKMPRMGEANCSIPVFSSEPRRGKRGNPLKHGIGCSCVPVQNLLSSNIQKNTPPLTCIPLGNWEVQYSKVALNSVSEHLGDLCAMLADKGYESRNLFRVLIGLNQKLRPAPKKQIKAVIVLSVRSENKQAISTEKGPSKLIRPKARKAVAQVEKVSVYPSSWQSNT